MRWNSQQHNLYQVFFDKQLVLWTSIWLENWFSFLLLFSVDISLCLSSLRLWAHASRVFQSNQKCPTSFWSRQHDFVWPWKFQHSVEWDSSPSNSLSWFSKLACGYQGRLQGCRHIWSNLCSKISRRPYSQMAKKKFCIFTCDSKHWQPWNNHADLRFQLCLWNSRAYFIYLQAIEFSAWFSQVCSTWIQQKILLRKQLWERKWLRRTQLEISSMESNAQQFFTEGHCLQ